jgi:hypothetical protein
MHARRHARDYERLILHSESLITWGRHHTHDQANHPPKLLQERTVGIPRSRPGLILLKVRAITWL